MTYPTEEEWNNWPAPNFVNPQSRKPIVIGVEIPITVIAATVVIARFYARTYIKHVLGWDDWLMMGAMICAIAITILHCLATQYATGLHLWDVAPSLIKPTGMLTYVSLAFFGPATSLAKISLSLTHLRILPSRSDRWFARCAIVFSVGYCISITLVNIFQCSPIRAYWSYRIDHYTCVHERPFNYASQALNSASDFLIFLWPARTLWTVRVPVKQRLMLIFVFSVGSAVCLTGVFRVYYLYRYFHSYDYFWEGSIIFILHVIEVNCAIICGCLPGIKPLLGRVFPNQFGSSVDRNNTNNTFSPHHRLPGACLTIRQSFRQSFRPSVRSPIRSLSHRPSTASMVEVPIKLDESWVPLEYPPPIHAVALGVLPEAEPSPVHEFQETRFEERFEEHWPYEEQFEESRPVARLEV
ncbi:hypothetical protein BT63DRAFT_380313 [Microthyrium microscopicum]|uniref:Rhodopsin domain-containing protein n=1 Tax=Microthyrium microscopicum TaxID=703497 RepID=A0A6A6TT51_9PEZI|nr:hypothetical protein BT63DRAFT_380313 [Microthyrium microscopicum]